MAVRRHGIVCNDIQNSDGITLTKGLLLLIGKFLSTSKTHKIFIDLCEECKNN